MIDVHIDNLDIEIKEANSFFERFKGLMFKSKIEYGLLFKNTNGIHTFFMRVPIDVVLFDDNFNIVEIIENIVPWRVIFPKKCVKHTLELPHGYAKYFKNKN